MLAHSDKDGAAPTYKATYGFHPILVTCDNTNELLALTLRPGNAGANTAADHLYAYAFLIFGCRVGVACARPLRQRRFLLDRLGRTCSEAVGAVDAADFGGPNLDW